MLNQTQSFVYALILCYRDMTKCYAEDNAEDPWCEDETDRKETITEQKEENCKTKAKSDQPRANELIIEKLVDNNVEEQIGTFEDLQNANSRNNVAQS